MVRDPILRMASNRPDKLDVLGLVLSLKDDGIVRVFWPIGRWNKLLTVSKVLNLMASRNSHITIASFLTAINDCLEEYIRYALQSNHKETRVVRLFRFCINLVISRGREFVRRTGCSSSGEPGQTIIQVLEEYITKTLVDSFSRIISEHLKDVKREPEG